MRKMVILIMFMIPGVILAQRTENFTGHWVLVQSSPFESKSNDTILDIVQTGNALEITQTTTVNGERKVEVSKYTLDGAENINAIVSGGNPATIRSKSSWKNGTLILQGTKTQIALGGEVVGLWKNEYCYSPDHGSLNIGETIHTPFGDVLRVKTFKR